MHSQGITNIECTVNLHKRLYGIKFKNRASRAIFEIKKFANSVFGGNNIRIDSKLNKEIWKSGPRHVPSRIRVRISKQVCLSKKDSDKWFLFVTLGKSYSLKNLQTKIC